MKRDAIECAQHDEPCHLCGDDAVVGQILQVDLINRTASVLLADSTAIVALDFVDATVGDRVLVHMGFAIEKLESA